ncbi:MULTISPECIES: phage holin family protein [unclassified Zymobacter]|uniref:phage holin family protein n=1 Tax=unclassified Zymobacter TaxID=3048685 RepID=UPI0039C397B2
MSDRRQGPAARAFSAARELVTLLLKSGTTRLRLAVVELQEERARLFSLLIMVFVALLLAAFGIGMLMLLITVYFWDTPYRLEAIAISAGVLLLLAVLLGWRALSIARKPTLLRSTLQRLTEDTEQINQHINTQQMGKRMREERDE